jgi:hypothetical protein
VYIFNLVRVQQQCRCPGCREPGWAGVARLRDHIVVARQHARELLVYQEDVQLRTLHASHNLHAVERLALSGGGTAPPAPLVATAEGPAVSLWDLRAARACVSRMQLGPESCIFALAAGPNGTIAAGGRCAAVAVWDLRSTTLLKRVLPDQSDITFVGFLGPDLDHCCIGTLGRVVTSVRFQAGKVCCEWPLTCNVPSQQAKARPQQLAHDRRAQLPLM